MFIDTLIIWYGVLSLVYIFTQISFSHAEYLSSSKDKRDYSFTPSLAIIIPSYNENEKDLIHCVKSALDQDYPGKYIVVLIDDGSKDKSGFYKTVKKFKNNPRFIYRNEKINRGKRKVQKIGFDLVDLKYDLVVTIDSDTILYRHTLQEIVQKFKDPLVGASTGEVRVIDRHRKILTRLLDGRYWAAFNQERASQSYFDKVLCCSGPLAAYRSEIIRKIKDKYISQRFLGAECTYGDDRHLTNLIIEQGYKVKYDRHAKAVTEVPLNIIKWIRQQVRWNKSFYREMIWTLKIFIKDPKKIHPYVIYEMTMQFFLPILLIISLIFTFYSSIYVNYLYAVGYFFVLIGMSVLRSLYALYRTNDKNFFLFPIYAVLHVFILIPVRIYALATLKTTHWGTRG